VRRKMDKKRPENPRPPRHRLVRTGRCAANTELLNERLLAAEATEGKSASARKEKRARIQCGEKRNLQRSGVREMRSRNPEEVGTQKD